MTELKLGRNPEVSFLFWSVSLLLLREQVDSEDGEAVVLGWVQ